MLGESANKRSPQSTLLVLGRAREIERLAKRSEFGRPPPVILRTTTRETRYLARPAPGPITRHRGLLPSPDPDDSQPYAQPAR